MSMLNIFNVSGSAVSAQSQRLNVVASNLANADTVAGPDGQAYKARQVRFQTELMGAAGAAGVKVSTISEDNSPGARYSAKFFIAVTFSRKKFPTADGVLREGS